MKKLFRIRLVGLLLLSTFVCAVSYFYANHSYHQNTYRWVLQQPPIQSDHKIITYTPALQATTRVNYAQIFSDCVAAVTAILLVYVLVVAVNLRARQRAPE